ncbi:unnamed protein product [Calypogeia fissa]
MADATKPTTPDLAAAPPKLRKPKPPSRKDSQRERDKKQRDNISEVEETIKRIGSHKGIIGTMICNGDGIPLQSTLDKATTLQYAAFLTPLAGRARIITNSHNTKDELMVLRIRTRANEIIITSDKDFYLIVAQKTSFLEIF